MAGSKKKSLDWKVDYVPSNSKTGKRLVRWFKSEAAARRFYKKLAVQTDPPESQGIMEVRRPR